jgi:hypothetical protein
MYIKATSHKQQAQATSNKPQATSKATSHKPQATSHKPTICPHCNNCSGKPVTSTFDQATELYMRQYVKYTSNKININSSYE